MRGSIRKRGETYTAYWFTSDAEGRRKQRSMGGFRRKKDASDHLTTVLGAVQAGTYSEPRKMTLAKFLREEWLPSVDKRPTTRASYETTVETWIIPTLGGVSFPRSHPNTCSTWSTSSGPPAGARATA